MKSNISNYKLQLAKDAETKLPHLLVNYTSGDLPSLGELCNSINVLAEFYKENPESDIAKRVPRLTGYINGKFRECTVLVLKKDNQYFGYSASEVTKFIRGETLHGASDNRDQKRKTLHDYVFEKDNNIECEFQISWNWIVGPNLRASSGNLDTGGAFFHSVVLNGNKREVSQIESTILAIAYEFWQANTNQEPKESTKCFVKFNPQWYSGVWGNKVADQVSKSLIDFHKITPPEHDNET